MNEPTRYIQPKVLAAFLSLQFEVQNSLGDESLTVITKFSLDP